MSLHGSIRVNFKTIGYWQAQRTSSVVSEVNAYDWEMELNGKSAWGVLHHRYRDGAAVLAQKVFAAWLEAHPPDPVT